MSIKKPTHLRTIESAVGPEILVDGMLFVNFGGSSYLGLSSNTTIIEAGIATLHEYGAGTPIHRSQCLVTRAHQEVESEASAFFYSRAALYLSSGYFLASLL